MGKLRTQNAGLLPKPPKLTELFKKWLKGEINYEDLLPQVGKYSHLIVRNMEMLGLTYVWDGGMHRWEKYHYAIMHVKNAKIIGKTLVYDFYYVPKGLINEKPVLNKNYYLNELMYIMTITEKPIKIPILGPYTLAEWSCKGQYIERWRNREPTLKLARYHAKREMVLDLIANIIRPILREFVSKIRTERIVIQIDEPAAGAYIDEIDILIEGVNEIASNINYKTTLSISHCDIDTLERIFQYICEVKVDQIMLGISQFDSWRLGVDANKRIGYYKPLKILIEEYGYKGEIGLGVISPYHSDIEKPELIRDRIMFAAKYIDINRLVINPDYDLKILGDLDKAFRKISNMVKGAKLAEEKLE